MNKETLHFSIGPSIGIQLLDIAQTNISSGNVEYGANVYNKAFYGFTDDLTLKVLKNQLVVITDEDGMGIHLSDDPKLIKGNAHNILDWKYIINDRIENMNRILKSITVTENEFINHYNGDILDYSILDMMKQYCDHKEMNTINDIANVVASICGHTECKICDKSSGNICDIWNQLEERVESYLEDKENEKISYSIVSPPKWEIILYLTVRYNKFIRLLHKEYVKFENTYLYLVENGFIEKPNKIEATLENVIEVLYNFADKTKGYYHPLCNTYLYEYKENIFKDLMNAKFGIEYGRYKILKKDIMDGYDGGWLSPDGDFYGGDGPTSAMIHLNIAEQIFKGTGPIKDAMDRDGVSEWGISNSPDYWLESHGWIKIHDNDCYGTFIGRRNEAPTNDYPYAYNPTDIQIKMICDYADKFYAGKFYTEANVLGRDRHPYPFTTYKVRQMDEFKIHEIFSY